jgi:hypothetical protein
MLLLVLSFDISFIRFYILSLVYTSFKNFSNINFNILSTAGAHLPLFIANKVINEINEAHKQGKRGKEYCKLKKNANTGESARHLRSLELFKGEFTWSSIFLPGLCG